MIINENCFFLDNFRLTFLLINSTSHGDKLLVRYKHPIFLAKYVID